MLNFSRDWCSRCGNMIYITDVNNTKNKDLLCVSCRLMLVKESIRVLFRSALTIIVDIPHSLNGLAKLC